MARVVATMEAVHTRLWVQTDVGGLARDERDWYHPLSRDLARVPGNPWIIYALWLAEWEIARTTSEADRSCSAMPRPPNVLPACLHPGTAMMICGILVDLGINQLVHSYKP
jgi:hypothetical protein